MMPQQRSTHLAGARRRAARTQSRTKQVVKLIKRNGDFDTLDVVKLFVPEDRFENLPVEAQNELIKLGAGLVDVVRAGQYDLRTSM